jgi:hypothetical protein
MLAAAAVIVPGLVGCADLQGPDVEQVVLAFTRPDADAASRCALLAPATLAAFEQDESTGCPQAIGRLELTGGPVRSTAIWGDNAQVRLGADGGSTGDTVFLTRTDQGWRVTAAGCQPQGDAPYRCRLEA